MPNGPNKHTGCTFTESPFVRVQCSSAQLSISPSHVTVSSKNAALAQSGTETLALLPYLSLQAE